MNYFEKWERSILASYSTPSIVLVKGSGVKVIDEHGKQYLDFLAGIAVNSLGHAHPAIVKAVTKQVETLGHVSNLAINKPSVDLAMKLLDLLQMPGGRIFFAIQVLKQMKLHSSWLEPTNLNLKWFRLKADFTVELWVR